MAFVRCYTGTDGQSHFEGLDLLSPDMRGQSSRPPAVSPSRVRPTAVQRLAQCAAPPVRHFPLRRPDEVGIGDGTTRRFALECRPVEDLTGQGHTSRSVGGDRLTAIVP